MTILRFSVSRYYRAFLGYASRGRRILPLFAFMCSLSGFTDTAILIDNSYLDWQKFPQQAVFSEYFNPLASLRERGGTAEILVEEDSLYWGKGGTHLREMKAYEDGENLYLYIESSGNFAYDLSIYFYLYAARNSDEENRFTLELLPGKVNMEGAALLWERGIAEPKIIGKLVSGSFMLECMIPLDALPADLAGRLQDYSFDLSTCYYETASGMYEEFFLSSFYVTEFTSPSTL